MRPGTRLEIAKASADDLHVERDAWQPMREDVAKLYEWFDRRFSQFELRLELDAEASSFAIWLKREDSQSSLRILRLFASVYESVRGQALIDEGWGEPLRAGRVDR